MDRRISGLNDHVYLDRAEESNQWQSQVLEYNRYSWWYLREWYHLLVGMSE